MKNNKKAVCSLSWFLTCTKLRPRLILNFWPTLRILNSIVRTEVYHHTCTNWTTSLSYAVCEKLHLLCYKHFISRMSSYWLQYIAVFVVSVNYLKYIFTSKIKKTEIVSYLAMLYMSMKIWYEPPSKSTVLSWPSLK